MNGADRAVVELGDQNWSRSRSQYPEKVQNLYVTAREKTAGDGPEPKAKSRAKDMAKTKCKAAAKTKGSPGQNGVAVHVLMSGV